MELSKLIESIFHTNNFTLEKTEKGYTNKNYLLRIQNNTYMVRVPWDHSEHIVNHIHEAKTIHAIQPLHLDVPTIYYNEATGIKISTYVEGLWEFQECPYPDKIERVAHLMKRLHQAKLHINETFDPIKRYLQYKEHLQVPFFDVQPFESILLKVQQMPKESVLCHNDWVSGNILFSLQRDYLIDYEYSADNDPLFDVMSFLSENNINDQSDRERFYQVYFDDITDSIRTNLAIWETFHNLLWCTWAMMMWEQRHEDIYKEIAQLKYQALQHSSLHIQ